MPRISPRRCTGSASRTRAAGPNLHLVPADSPRFRDELAFRDRLRASSSVAAEYAELKRDLAQRFANDREAYTDAKADFVRRTLRG